MYALVMRHETRTLTRSPAFLWVLLLLLAALGFGAWSGTRTLDHQARGMKAMVSDTEAIRTKFRVDLEKYERKIAATGEAMQMARYTYRPGEVPLGTNPGAVSKKPEPAVLPPTGLAAFATGQSDLQLSYVAVSAVPMAKITEKSELGNPVNLKRGSFDLAFVIVFLLPIFILAISYDMLSSEHERGTLAMVLSHPISLGKLMTSKVISRAAIIVAVVLAGGFAALLTIGTQLDSPDTWMRFGLWIAATLLYSCFWFALAVLVNAMGRNSATNGLVLAGVWLALTAVVPTLVSVVATSTYPTPSRFDFITASRDAQTASEKNYVEALNQYFYDHVEYTPGANVKDFLAVSMAKADAVDKAMAPLYARFQTQLARQDRMVSRFQFLSPAIMMQQALNSISGTDAGRYANFIEQVSAFRTEWTGYFAKRFLNDEPLRSAEYDQIPRFQYQEEPRSVPLSRTAPALLGMGILAMLITLLAVNRIRRYQVAAR